MPDDEPLIALRDLLRQQRWAALATLNKQGNPEASMVAYVMSEDFSEAYLHLSELAAHTRNLQQQPRASLAVSVGDSGNGDPQQLPRASLFGQVEILPRDDPHYEAVKQKYLTRLPDAEPLFGFGDFRLFRMRVDKARYVGGFARAYSLPIEQLRLC